MNKTLISILLSGFLLLPGVVGAQSFAAGSRVTEPAQKITPQGAVAPASDTGVDSAVLESEENEENDLLVNSVEKNFGDGENIVKKEEVYDNKYGKVAHMKIVDGKVVFDDERYILVYYDDFKVERGFDGITRCSMRIYVLNDLTERINNLALKLKWPEISTNVQMTKVNQGVRTYMDIMLLGDGCLSMDKAPTIEVNRCRVKGMSEDKCADAIRWFKKNQ